MFYDMRGVGTVRTEKQAYARDAHESATSRAALDLIVPDVAFVVAEPSRIRMREDHRRFRPIHDLLHIHHARIFVERIGALEVE